MKYYKSVLSLLGQEGNAGNWMNLNEEMDAKDELDFAPEGLDRIHVNASK